MNGVVKSAAGGPKKLGRQAKLARGAQVAVVFAAVVQVLVAIGFGVSFDHLSAAAASGKTLFQSDTLYENIGHALMFTVVGAYFMVCAWLWRARQLTSRIAPGEAHRMSIGYVWVAWLIPLANLWLPARLLSDIREVSTEGRQAFGKPIVATGDPVWWWALAFAAFGIVKAVVPQFLEISGQRVLQDPVSATVGWLEWTAAGSAVVAAALWWRLVESIRVVQDEAEDWPDPPVASPVEDGE